MQLVKTRIRGCVWEGVLTSGLGSGAAPKLSVSHSGTEVGVADVSPDPDHTGSWTVRVTIPPDLVSDGVQAFTIHETGAETVLTQFAVVTGEAVPEDLRVEVELLRAELDMLKRAFRRHCTETM